MGQLLNIYREKIQRRVWLFLVLLFLLSALIIFAIAVGPYRLSLNEVIRSLSGLETGTQKVVVWDIRMPRIVAAIITGCALGISGMAIQCLLRNPLASPFTLGISQGAAFGAAFSIVVLNTGSMKQSALNTYLGAYATTTSAFIGAISATIIILLLARLKKMSPEAIILAGVALSSLFTSGTILIQYFATEGEIASVVFWTFGDVARSGWQELAILSVATILVIVYFFIHCWDLNAMTAGEDVGRSLGVGLDRLRLVGMSMAALVSALATAFNGVIAFLGLLAPHIARRLVGSDYRLLIPFSCLVGALLLLAADTAGRLMVGSGTLPVGVLTSFMGAPLFLYLLIKGLGR